MVVRGIQEYTKFIILGLRSVHTQLEEQATSCQQRTLTAVPEKPYHRKLPAVPGRTCLHNHLPGDQGFVYQGHIR